MRTILKILSYGGLVLTILPSLLVLSGAMEFGSHYYWTLAGTLIWFITAPFWVDRKKKVES